MNQTKNVIANKTEKLLRVRMLLRVSSNQQLDEGGI